MRKCLFILLVAVFARAGALHAEPCRQLQQAASPQVTVSFAGIMTSGTFILPGNKTNPSGLPAFCRVVANLTPTQDSLIGMELWLPLTGWNGKYMAVGSGGWGGSINYEGMAEALRRGYATSATDDGHRSEGAAFLMGHAEKFIDFAYRAEHETAVESKALIKAFYSRDARYSYWNGCSGGGREGLLQAARYPNEFDGIIAGDPANVRRNAWALWLANQTFKEPAALIPPSKYPMIHRAVLDACDANDGLKDGLIDNPEACHVDFKALTCKAADGPDCLTPRQVESAQALISPLKDEQGAILFERLEPGTELRWGRLAGGPQPADLFLDQFRYLVYGDSNWDWRSFDLARDSAKANAIDKDVDELDAHLTAFANHGKLLLYHGWADQQVAPGSTVDFYRQTSASSGDPAHASQWVRLFMAPGMGHCSGGEGPDHFDKISVMEEWVEQGKAPDRIIATHLSQGKPDRTRPLCPYPQSAHYRGSGSIDDAANFTCTSTP
ncbi:MAG: tannase/feruloyl esterase family alpha/beta hydrolase [Acidobacteriaceae bacterium]